MEEEWVSEFAVSDEELIKELLDYSPLIILPKQHQQQQQQQLRDHCVHGVTSTTTSSSRIHHHYNYSSAYSGPTIKDIESALPISMQRSCTASQPIVVLRKNGMDNMENNKYKIMVKICKNGMADDGFKWTKYGQKSIKSSQHARSYYRCTNPRCNAKKQVEKSTEDPDTIIITYEGIHLHYAYSNFQMPKPSNQHQSKLSPLKRSQQPKKIKS